MTDPASPLPADSAPEAPPPRLLSAPASAAPPSEASPPLPEEPPLHPRRSDALAWLGVIGFLLLAGGIGYVWWLTQQPPPGIAALAQRVTALEQRPAAPQQGPAAMQQQAAALQALQARVVALEHRPAPDLADVQSQLAALQQRQTPDLAPLQAQIASLQHAQQAAQSSMTALQHEQAAAQARLGALEKQVATNSQSVATAAELTDRLNSVATQVQALAARDQNAAGILSHRLDAAETRLAALEHNTADMMQMARHAARLARIEMAQAALAAGEKLGDIAGAPPAVAHFAGLAPPTEAALRLSFPKAAEAALAAASPATSGKPFLQQMLTRAEDLVTVRQGDHVLLGNPVAGLLARAHAALDAGDLTGAISAVSGLTGAPAQAMADWLAQARALLAARAGLAAMAAHA